MTMHSRVCGLVALAGLQLLGLRPAGAKTARELTVRLEPRSGLDVAYGGSSINLQIGAWFRGQVLDLSDASARARFKVPLLRPVLQVHLWDRKVLLFVQPELAGSGPKLLDAFLEWAPRDEFHLRAGRFRTPYSRAYITPIFQLALPGRGLVVDRFRLGRDTGLMAFGRLLQHRLEYAVGVFSGIDINSPDTSNPGPLVIGRVALNFGQPVPYDQVPSLDLDAPRGVSFALAGAWRGQRGSRTSGSPASFSEESWHGEADVTLMQGPLAATAEAFLQETRQPGAGWGDSYGAFLQFGAFVLPRQLELGARAGWLSTERGALSTEAFVTLFWRYGDEWFGHHLKTTLAYRRDDYGRAATTRDFQSVMLQTQVWL